MPPTRESAGRLAIQWGASKKKTMGLIHGLFTYEVVLVVMSKMGRS